MGVVSTQNLIFNWSDLRYLAGVICEEARGTIYCRVLTLYYADKNGEVS